MKISSVSYHYNFIPNHLGSGTLITDINGNPYQFFLNLPFGETFVDRHSHTGEYENVYKFNGKELDTETNLYYYGARYYNPRISQFYATDPLAEKYPNFSPYTYTADNPVMLVDPNGMDWYKNNETGETTWFDGNGKQKGYTYLGYFVSETDVDGNKTFYDGATKSKYVNEELEESWDNLDAVEVVVSPNKKSTKEKIISTVLVGFNAYAGGKEMMTSAEMLAVPDPTFLTKITGGYLALDGYARTLSSPFIIYGIWADNKELQQAPDNLLATIGYIVDQNSSKPSSRKYQISFGLIGDFGLQRKNLINNANRLFKATNTVRKIQYGGLGIKNIFSPYFKAYKKIKNYER